MPHPLARQLAGQAQGAELLSWQSRFRILAAALASVAEIGLLVFAGDDSAFAPIALAGTVAYLVFAIASAVLARRRSVGPLYLSIAACADVGLAFAVTLAFSAPAAYGRILIFSFVVVHLSSFYVGHRAAIAAIVTTVVLYIVVVASGNAVGAALEWGQELWSLAAFVFAATVVVAEQARLRDRLENIARLFSHAEDGDFSEAYDEVNDVRPDSITSVGRSYNRVREHLANLVLTDPLTGCENRRGFEQALEREVARAARSGQDISLLALDVDHFKSINDTYGHLAGDEVLREMGELLLKTARTGDIVARTGGEEFSLVLPNTGPEGALHLATRLCEAIRSHKFSGERPIRMTASVGVVSQKGGEGLNGDAVDVLKGRADEALYTAKRAGRDRVVVFGH